MNNTRGDVLELRKADGTLYCKYVYDSWGRLVSAKNASGNNLSASTIGYQNSIRYRGYVYDHETGLYYLQSRYYDPETGRFLNADDAEYIGYSGGQLSYNAFAYCENNAVCRADLDGKDWSYVIFVFFNVGMLYECLVRFLEDYLNLSNYEIKSFSCNNNDFCRARVWYRTVTYKNKSKKIVTDNISIFYGTRDMWEYASTHVDTLYGFESVNELLELVDSSDIYESIIPLIVSVITLIYSVYYNYELYSNYNEVYNYVWGTLDPNDIYCYVAYCISGATNEYEKMNGFHAYSFVTYDKKEILV